MTGSDLIDRAVLILVAAMPVTVAVFLSPIF